MEGVPERIRLERVYIGPGVAHYCMDGHVMVVSDEMPPEILEYVLIKPSLEKPALADEIRARLSQWRDPPGERYWTEEDDALADRVEALVTAVREYEDKVPMLCALVEDARPTAHDWIVARQAAVFLRENVLPRAAPDTAQEEEPEPTCNCDAEERPWRFCELHEGGDRLI